MAYTQAPPPGKSTPPVQDGVMRLLSKDTNTALREVTSTIKKLAHVYTEETEALNKTDSDTFMALQDKKLTIALEYQSDMSQMLARKKEVEMADPAIKENLKNFQKDFSELSRKNLEALGRMQRCTERLGNTIRSAAIRDVQKQRGYSYGENGTISHSSQRKAVSSGLSETV